MAQITILTASRTLQCKEVRSGLDKSFSALYNDLDSTQLPYDDHDAKETSEYLLQTREI
ncbi:hypothetical protein BDR03DRAFT_963682 [Suillus americanus]|nr:hypothetical protein BDR03DRAFT_963682 [Suillus americanus]